MKLTFIYDFSTRIKKGTEVEIDKIKYKKECSSGIMVRVVGLWKKPTWFDLGYFMFFGEK